MELTRSKRRMIEIEGQNLCLQSITIKDDDLAGCFGDAMSSFYVIVRRISKVRSVSKYG